MSIPMKGIPPGIPKFLRPYRKAFTKPNFEHYKTLITGLIVSDNKTLEDINDSFHRRNQSSFNRFVTTDKCDIEAVKNIRMAQIQRAIPDRRGSLIVDDTLSHKTGKKMEYANYHYSGMSKKKEWGHNIVTTHFVGGACELPVDYDIYIRQEDCDDDHPFKNKRQLALEQVDYALENGFRFDVMADCWYYSEDFIRQIKFRELHHILGVKSNLKISIDAEKRVSTKEYAETLKTKHFKELKIDGVKYIYHAVDCYIRGVGKEKLLVTKREDDEDFRYFVTDHVKWSGKRIFLAFLKRGKIEHFYRDAKQHLGLEDYQLRKFGGIQVVVLAVFVAYTLLILNKLLGILKPLRRALNTIGECCRYFRLVALKGWWWIHRISKDLSTLKEVFNRYVFVKNAKV